MTLEGLAAIDQLAAAIVELERAIPREIDWALQVDGHTDSRAIATPQFPSNWELSSARATSVVKYLISRGVPAKRLVAAGYGEFQPLEEGTSEEVLRRQREGIVVRQRALHRRRGGFRLCYRHDSIGHDEGRAQHVAAPGQDRVPRLGLPEHQRLRLGGAIAQEIAGGIFDDIAPHR